MTGRVTGRSPPPSPFNGRCPRKAFLPCPGSCRGQSPAQSEALLLPLSGGAAVPRGATRGRRLARHRRPGGLGAAASAGLMEEVGVLVLPPPPSPRFLLAGDAQPAPRGGGGGGGSRGRARLARGREQPRVSPPPVGAELGRSPR